jgi:hypothetical protein
MPLDRDSIQKYKTPGLSERHTIKITKKLLLISIFIIIITNGLTLHTQLN